MIDAALPTMVRNPKLKGTVLHGLVQEGTGRLMAISDMLQTITSLSQWSGYAVPRINVSSFGKVYLKSDNVRLQGNVWDWRYNPETQFIEYDPNPADIDNNYCIRLVAEKAAMLDIVNSWTVALRRPRNADILMQQNIHKIKATQAQAYVDNPSIDPSQYSYIKQYADIYDVSIDEAAQKVLIQARALDKIMFDTEGIRLRYYKAIKEARSIAQVRALKTDFSAEKLDPVIFGGEIDFAN